jgi:hypothetical protein
MCGLGDCLVRLLLLAYEHGGQAWFHRTVLSALGSHGQQWVHHRLQLFRRFAEEVLLLCQPKP